MQNTYMLTGRRLSYRNTQLPFIILILSLDNSLSEIVQIIEQKPIVYKFVNNCAFRHGKHLMRDS